MGWQPLGAFVAGLLVATVTTPAGVSGAVLLLPVQVSILGVPSPAVTATNLLYNVIATPSGLLRYRARFTTLARTLLVGTVPGVVLGAVIRVEWLAGQRLFLAVVAVVLAALAASLLLGGIPSPLTHRRPASYRLAALAFGVGVIGGIYGIGGGSILAPLLLVSGYSAYEVAPAALMSTFAASVVGVLAFVALATAKGGGTIMPEWHTGIPLGAGGVVGAYIGASIQPRISERALRHLLGVVVLLIAVRYAYLVVAP